MNPTSKSNFLADMGESKRAAWVSAEGSREGQALGSMGETTHAFVTQDTSCQRVIVVAAKRLSVVKRDYVQ